MTTEESTDVRPSPQAITAFGLANEVLDDHEDVWALNYYSDDGGVVVNVTAGWEDVVGDEPAELVATAPAPVEILEVAHSHDELMEPAHLPGLGDIDFAGASMTGAYVDAERNVLVVALTLVNEETVTAAAEVFGPNAMFSQGESATPAVGT